MSKAEYFKAERLKLEAQGLSTVEVWERLESVILADSKLFQRWTDAKIKADTLAHKNYHLSARMPKADSSIAEAIALEWAVQRQASMPYAIEAPLGPEAKPSKFIGPSRKPAMFGTAKRIENQPRKAHNTKESKATWQPQQGIPVLSR